MALDLKSVARNQFASRTSRALKGGLTKVAGNILGSALGSASPANLPRIGFGGSGPFSVKMLNFPSDVASDPRQGHYINFSVYETVPAKVGTMDNASKKFAAFSGPELMGSMGSTDQRRQPTGATGPEILGGGGPGPGPSRPGPGRAQAGPGPDPSRPGPNEGKGRLRTRLSDIKKSDYTQ